MDSHTEATGSTKEVSFLHREGHRLVLSKRAIAYVAGLGLALMAFHVSWLPQQLAILVPQLGVLLIAGAMLVYAEKGRKWDRGPWYVWVPMLVIVLSAWARLAIDFSLHTAAGAVFLTLMVPLYMMARDVGKSMFRVFAPLVVIEAASIVLYGATHQWARNGGLLSFTNYDMAAGFLAFGALLAFGKWQWAIMLTAAVGMVFTGAPEAAFILAVLAVAMAVRRDWVRRNAVPLMVAGIVVAALFVFGPGFHYATSILGGGRVPLEIGAPGQVVDYLSDGADSLENPIGGRLRVIGDAMSRIGPLGHGLVLTEFTGTTVHNVPLIIIDQIGPLAAMGWLAITSVCLVKSRWKYAWVGIVAMGVFDHYTWTMVAPWYWALAGASLTATNSDMVLRRG